MVLSLVLGLGTTEALPRGEGHRPRLDARLIGWLGVAVAVLYLAADLFFWLLTRLRLRD